MISNKEFALILIDFLAERNKNLVPQLQILEESKETTLEPVVTERPSEEIEETNIAYVEKSLDKSTDEFHVVKPIEDVEFKPIQDDIHSTFLIKLQQYLFKSDIHLKNNIPHSFCVQTTHNELKSSFYWVGEKIGIVYLVSVSFKKPDIVSSTFSIVANHIISNLITETKIINMQVILQEFIKQFTELALNEDALKYHDLLISICMIDKLNTKLHFLGNGIHLIVKDKETQKIRGNFLHLLDNHPKKDHRFSCSIQKGAYFYILTDIQSEKLKEGLDVLIMGLSNKDFENHKEILEEYIDKNNTANQVIQILGFTF